MYRTTWEKCNSGSWWCQFDDDSDISSLPKRGGVYVVWRGMDSPINEPSAVYVGKAVDIRSRIARHRVTGKLNRGRIPGYTLYVTWTAVPVSGYVSSGYCKKLRKGVERYLADVLNPVVGMAHPRVDPIPVNLPGPFAGLG